MAEAETVDFAAATEWLEENNAPDGVRAAFDKSKLRQVIAEKEALVQELTPYRDKYLKVERQPKRDEAFRKAGLDFDSLRKADKALLDGFSWDGDEPDPEQVKTFIAEWELPITEGTEGETDESLTTPASGRIGQEASRNPGAKPSEKTLYDQIADAEKAGEYMKALTLKAQLITSQNK